MKSSEVSSKTSIQNTSPMPQDKMNKTNKKVLTIIFVSLLLDLIAFTMILPLFPSLLDYYDKSEGNGNGLYGKLLSGVRAFQRISGVPERFSSVLFGGALGSMFSFLQFLASPVVGSLSDAFGRKPFLLICLVGIAVSHAMWGYARTFSMFVAARFVGGLSKANVSLSMAVVTDATDEKTRPKGMALVGLAFSVGFIAGPVAGAWFGRGSGLGSDGLWGERPAMYALTLALANVALVYLCLPETLDEKKRSPSMVSLSRALDFVSPYHLMNFTTVSGLSKSQTAFLSKMGPIYFMYLFVYSGLEFTLTFLTHHTFGFTAMEQGKMFLVIGVIMAALQGGAARRLGARGAALAARGALLLTPVSYALVALAALPRPPLLPPLQWLWAGLVLFAVATAFAVSCMSSLAGGAAPAESRGAVLGTLRSLGALARGAGPLLASTMYWGFGADVTYAVGGLLLVIPAVMFCKLKS